MVDFTRERTENGVVERLFDLTVNGERVPAVLWSPEGAKGERPLILMGHGGSQHKKIGTLAARARQYAQRQGYAVLAIDAPGHGDRISREQAAKLAAEVGARVRGEPGTSFSADMLKTMAERTQKAVPEWKAALDAVQTLAFVGRHERVGYWGVSMGTAIGIPFVASEPRIKCAVFGLAGLRSGRPPSRMPPRRFPFRLSSSFSGRTPWRRARAASRSSMPSARPRKPCTSIPARISRFRISNAPPGSASSCVISERLRAAPRASSLNCESEGIPGWVGL